MRFPAELEIEVTKEDIAEGVPKESSFCPIAIALTRLISPHDKIVCITVGTIWIEIKIIKKTGFKTIGYNHSSASKTFTRDFDNKIKVKPATFRLTKLPNFR